MDGPSEGGRPARQSFAQRKLTRVLGAVTFDKHGKVTAGMGLWSGVLARPPIQPRQLAAAVPLSSDFGAQPALLRI